MITMREIKLPFGRAGNGTMIPIRDAVRGLDCACVCPQCFALLVACKGDVVRPYFRHYADPAICVDARETALHLYAKQLIVRALRLVLPDDLGPMKRATAEARLPIGVQPDVLAEYQTGETVAIEVWVAHQVPTNKVSIYAQHHQAALEIDLRHYRHVDETDWEKVILETAERAWIYPPQVVRIENERKRQEIIDGMRREREAAQAAMDEAQRARQHEQQKLEALKEAEERRLQIAAIDQALAFERQRLAAAEHKQELVKRAEERNRTAELRAAMARRRMRERQPPDLQALVAAFGFYSAITPEAWAQFDGDLAAWKEKVRDGYFYTHEYREAIRLAS